ncbi:MAG: HNH endonuclease [Candidatus Thorarchaeota archaeon]
MFNLGELYRREKIHDRYGGQRQQGISIPSGKNYIFLFTGESGKQYGYQDEWTDNGQFLYTGEGQKGDMKYLRGNLQIVDHIKNGKDIYLFKYQRVGLVRYIGQMICTGHHEDTGKDINNNDRKIIIFELSPIDKFEKLDGNDDDEITKMWEEPLNVLRENAIKSSSVGRDPKERKSFVFNRSELIKIYANKRANGICEACEKPAPFISKTGKPYLETHHIRRLTDGGPDHPKYVIGLYPNCHCRAHHGKDHKEFNRRLQQIVNEKEN